MASYVIQILVEAKDKNTKQIARGVSGEIERMGDTAERTGDRMRQAMTGAAIAMTFGRALPMIRSSLDAYNDLRAGLVGLQSIVKHVGEDWDEAKAAVQAYTADGLIPFSQGTLALKNMLLRGYGLEKSIELLYRLKDAAAYGRQGTLTLGQAVASAAEGLKNMNPILVDNAGVTKNMSRMYIEYAAAIGTTSAKLTDQQKIEAEYIGIMGETEAMVGNALKLTEELAGEEARLEAQTRTLKEAIGGALAPAYRDLLADLSPIVGSVTEFVKANSEATVTLLGGAGLVAAVGALAAVFALMGTGGAVVVAVAAALVGVATAAAKLNAQLRPSTTALETAGRVAGENADRVRALKEEYVDLSGKPDASKEEHERLVQVMRDLRDVVPEAVAALSDEGEVLQLNASRVDAYVQAMDLLRKRKIGELMRKQVREEAAVARITKELTDTVGLYAGGLSEAEGLLQVFEGNINAVGKALADQATSLDGAIESDEELLDTIESLATELIVAERQLKQTTTAVDRLTGATDEAGDAVDDTNKSIENTGDSAADAAAKMKPLIDRMKEAGYFVPENWLEMIEQWRQWREEIRGADEDLGSTGEKLGTFEQRLAEMGKRWGDWEGAAADALGGTSNFVADFFAYSATGNEEMLEEMMDDWDNFAQHIIAQLIRIAVHWAFMKIFSSFVIPGFGKGGVIGGDVVGSDQSIAGAQHGGMIQGPVPGFDSVLLRGMPGELVTSVPLTRDLELMVADWKRGGGVPSGAAGVDLNALADLVAARIPSIPITIHAMDAESIRRSLRDGDLGRELVQALNSGRLSG